MQYKTSVRSVKNGKRRFLIIFQNSFFLRKGSSVVIEMYQNSILFLFGALMLLSVNLNCFAHSSERRDIGFGYPDNDDIPVQSQNVIFNISLHLLARACQSCLLFSFRGAKRDLRSLATNYSGYFTSAAENIGRC